MKLKTDRSFGSDEVTSVPWNPFGLFDPAGFSTQQRILRLFGLNHILTFFLFLGTELSSDCTASVAVAKQRE